MRRVLALLVLVAAVLGPSCSINAAPLGTSVGGAGVKYSATELRGNANVEQLQKVLGIVRKAESAKTSVHPLLAQFYDALLEAEFSASVEDAVSNGAKRGAKSSQGATAETSFLDFLLKAMGRKVSDASPQGKSLNGKRDTHAGKHGSSRSDKPTADSDAASTERVEIRVEGVLKSQADADKVREHLDDGCGAMDVTIRGRGVYAWIPAESVPCLASVVGVQSWLPSLAFHHQASTGPVLSQGLQAMRAGVVRSHWNLTGSGIKVGILSGSFDACGCQTAPSQAAGELPLDLQILADYTDPGPSDEGRAMAEIIHDVAPGASIVFHTALGSQVAFADAITTLFHAGCHILVDDVLYATEPVYFDGTIAAAVNAATKSGGAVYVSAAGNFGDNSYEGPFTPLGGTGPAHDFDPSTNESSTLTLTGDFAAAPVCVVLQWECEWATQGPWVAKGQSSSAGGGGGGGCMSDLDLSIEAIELEGWDSHSDNIGGDPVELICLQTNSTRVSISVTLVAGDPPPNLKIIVLSSSVHLAPPPGGTGSSTVVGHAAAESAISVGAAFYNDTPAWNPDLRAARLEPFSSKGGTRILYDEAGNSLGPEGVVRQTPTVVGPDGGNATFTFPIGFDVQIKGVPTSFFGTSAAAAHVAGVLALYMGAIGSVMALPTPASVKSLVESVALNMSDPAGYDAWTGFGFLDGLVLFEYSAITLRESDRGALLAFLDGIDTDVAKRVLPDWSDDPVSDVCTWTGVTCSSGYPYVVVELDLAGMGLRGVVSPVAGGVTQITASMRRLDISHNILSGSLPPEFSRMTRLETLNVRGNRITGTIPFSFDTLRRLTNLNVRDNPELGGCIPFHVAAVTNTRGTRIPGGLGRICGETEATAIPVPSLPFSYQADTRGFRSQFDAVSKSEPSPLPPAVQKKLENIAEGGSSPGVVFEYVAKSSGPVNVSLCAGMGATFDTYLMVYDANGEFGHPRGNDDCCGVSGGPGQLQIILEAGTRYFVVVTGFFNSSGPFHLNIHDDYSVDKDAVSVQRDALLDFKSQLVDASSALSSWTGGDFCSWFGVYCTSKIFASMLHMHKAGLQGRVSPSLGSLPLLTMLDISGNDLEGGIPYELAGPDLKNDPRTEVLLNFSGNRRMAGCVPEPIAYTKATAGSPLFWTWINGTGLGGACDRGKEGPLMSCPASVKITYATTR
eukprot:jgi/Mesvir1/7607/Mv06338-RA.1